MGVVIVGPSGSGKITVLAGVKMCLECTDKNNDLCEKYPALVLEE